MKEIGGFAFYAIIYFVSRVTEYNLVYVKIFFLAIYLFGLLSGLKMMINFGEFDFSFMPEHTGDFGVGIKKIHTKRLKHLVHVFYPTDQQKW